MIKDKGFFEQRPGFSGNVGFRRRLAKKIAPDFVTYISNHQATDDSSHGDDAIERRVEESPAERLQCSSWIEDSASLLWLT